MLFGLAIGLAIAGYTMVDSEGLDHADPLAYLVLVPPFARWHIAAASWPPARAAS